MCDWGRFFAVGTVSGAGHTARLPHMFGDTLDNSEPSIVVHAVLDVRDGDQLRVDHVRST